MQEQKAVMERRQHTALKEMNTFPVKGAYINSLQAAYKKTMLQTGAICSSKSVAMLRSLATNL